MPEQKNVNFSNRNSTATDGIEDATSYTMEQLLQEKEKEQGYSANNGTGYSLDDDETPSFTREDLSVKPQAVTVEEITQLDANDNVLSKTQKRKFVEVPKAPKTFSYGDGNITAKEYANNIWGDQTTQEDIQEIAKIFAGKKNYDPEADAGLYKVNTESTSKAKLVGQYIGERGGKYNTSYVDELGGSVTGNINEGIKFGQELAEKDNQIDHFSKYIDKNMREEIRTNVENDQVEKILDKLENNRAITDPQEIEILQKAKDTYNKAHNQFINVRDQLGFSQEENIYSDYDDSDIKTSARFRNKVNGNVTYQSLKRNQRLLDYNIEYDENGVASITGHKGDYANSFKTEEPITDFLAEANSIRDLDDANKVLSKDSELSKTSAVNYMEDFKEATYGNKSAERILELEKAGVKVERGDEILRSYMAAHNSNVQPESEAITYLNKASDEAIKNINISDENIQYINNKKSGLSLDYEDGKVRLSDSSISLMNDDMKSRYKDIIESDDIGSLDLTGINRELDTVYRQNSVLYDISNSVFEKEYGTRENDYKDAFNNFYEQNKDLSIEEVQNKMKDIEATGRNMSFEDIRKGASSNYNRITGSYASERYGDYALSNDEVLKRSGVTNENIRKEILGAKNFDDLSPEAMGALYGANTKLSQRDINLGNFELNNKEIESIEKMNPELGKKLRDISAGDKAQILGRTQEEVSNYLGLDKDGLTSKLEMKRNASLDINDPKVARKVLEDLSNKNPEEALADLIDFTGNRKGYGDLKGGGQANKVLDAFRAGTLERDLRSGRLEQAYGIVRDTIDEIKSIHGKDFAKEYDQFDAKTNSMKDKFSVENMKKQAKNFDKADYDRIDAAFDKGLEATAKRMENLSGPLTRKSGNLGKIGSFFGSGKGKVALGVAGGMAAIFGVASIAGNAAEERERKRQEMNQLIAAQNANIRSGY